MPGTDVGRPFLDDRRRAPRRTGSEGSRRGRRIAGRSGVSPSPGREPLVVEHLVLQARPCRRGRSSRGAGPSRPRGRAGRRREAARCSAASRRRRSRGAGRGGAPRRAAGGRRRGSRGSPGARRRAARRGTPRASPRRWRPRGGGARARRGRGGPRRARRMPFVISSTEAPARRARLDHREDVAGGRAARRSRRRRPTAASGSREARDDRVERLFRHEARLRAPDVPHAGRGRRGCRRSSARRRPARARRRGGARPRAGRPSRPGARRPAEAELARVGRVGDEAPLGVDPEREGPGGLAQARVAPRVETMS